MLIFRTNMNRIPFGFATLILLILSLLVVASVFAQPPSVGDCVRLRAYSDLGVPLHPGPGRNGVSGRLADGVIASVEDFDEETGWYAITSDEGEGWIVRRYILETVDCAGMSPEVGELRYRVGCWNLEYFHDGRSRGFPENTKGGPTLPPRTESDYEAIAAIIERLNLKILVLEEIFAREEVEDGIAWLYSSEMERLVDILGEQNYAYLLAESGSVEHIAILYDTRAVRLNAICPTDFESEKVQGSHLFDRQPAIAHFTFLVSDQPRNDLLVVGVHLASGQSKRKNHDAAMEQILDELELARQEEICLPFDEHDIVILGDFNANRFDDDEEEFWNDMEGDGWDVLADAADDYPPTRLAGVPLEPWSVIDYIIVTAGERGLQGEEIDAQTASVHTDLAADPDDFRRCCSDHLPVTVDVLVTADSDAD